MKRRTFLGGATATVAAGVAPMGTRADGGGATQTRLTFDQDQWATIQAVQDHLLPAEPNAPGSRDIHALSYLDRTLADPKFDPDVRGFILNGIGWLEAIAQITEARPFHQVAPAGREELLRQIADSSAGERWLSTLVTYTLEALLADPLYGCNPQGIGWRWLDHHPGNPRPKPAKIYARLGRA